jgi:hypothetical protein
MCTSHAVLGMLVAVERNSLFSDVLLLLSRHSPGIDTMRLHILHVSAYCGHHQVRRAFTVTLPSATIPPNTSQCLHIGSALCTGMFMQCPMLQIIFNIKKYSNE